MSHYPIHTIASSGYVRGIGVGDAGIRDGLPGHSKVAADGVVQEVSQHCNGGRQAIVGEDGGGGGGIPFQGGLVHNAPVA